MCMGIFSGLFKSRDKPQNRTSGSGYSFFFGGSTAGKNVNERSAMQMTAVYSCVRILAEAVAGLPLHLYRYKEDGGKEKALDHPLYNLLHDEPNPEMSSFVFRETLMTHLLLWGNAYAQIIRNGKGEVIALYPLMPNRMVVDRDTKGRLYYQYTTSTEDAPTMKGVTVNLPPSDVLHIPGLGFDGLVGYSPIAMAKNAIGMAIACEEYGAKFFANGAAPGGVLEHPGTIKDPQRVRESWQSTFGGSGNANKIAVLEEGMKYTPIGISPEQAQFLETRKFQVNEIARIFRVPPHMVGDLEKSSFSNIEQQSLEFVKYTLDPWVIRWEQTIHRSLLLPDEKSQYFVKFNLEGLLRGDYQSRMNGYAIGRQNGWMSANDIRELENLDRIPAEEGGDLYLINGNMLPLKDAGAFAYLSLKLGEGEVPAAKRGVGNAVSLAVIVNIVLAAVFLLCIDPILTLFGATDILRPYALEYGYIIGIGLPFMMISASINSMIRADGSPKYAMFSMVIGAILNVILDPVLIFIFEMGVQCKTRLLPSAVNLAAAAEPSEKRWQRSWGCPAMTKSWSKRSQPRAASAKPTFRKPGNMRRADFCRLRFPTMTRDPILRTCSGRSNTKPSESWPRRDPA